MPGEGGPAPGRAPGVTDRARRVGAGPDGRPSYISHPLRPLQGLRGPLRWICTSPRAAGWVPGITPPVYPPRIPTR